VKIPQWILPLSSRTQRVPFFLCLSAHRLNAHLAEFPFHRTFSSSVFYLCTPCTCSMPTWQSFSESSVILASSELTTEFLPQAPLCICSMPTWQSFTEFTAEFCLQLCLSYTALPPRYSTTLRSSPELLTPVPVPQHVFV
jgi:hypothetical protein